MQGIRRLFCVICTGLILILAIIHLGVSIGILVRFRHYGNVFQPERGIAGFNIVIGLYGLIIGGFGLFSVLTDHGTLSKIVAVAAVVLTVFTFVSLITALIIHSLAITYVSSRFSDHMNNYKNDQDSRNIVDQIQINFDCCGTNTWLDWSGMSLNATGSNASATTKPPTTPGGGGGTGTTPGGGGGTGTTPGGGGGTGTTPGGGGGTGTTPGGSGGGAGTTPGGGGGTGTTAGSGGGAGGAGTTAASGGGGGGGGAGTTAASGGSGSGGGGGAGTTAASGGGSGGGGGGGAGTTAASGGSGSGGGGAGTTAASGGSGSGGGGGAGTTAASGGSGGSGGGAGTTAGSRDSGGGGGGGGAGTVVRTGGITITTDDTGTTPMDAARAAADVTAKIKASIDTSKLSPSQQAVRRRRQTQSDYGGISGLPLTFIVTLPQSCCTNDASSIDNLDNLYCISNTNANNIHTDGCSKELGKRSVGQTLGLSVINSFLIVIALASIAAFFEIDHQEMAQQDGFINQPAPQYGVVDYNAPIYPPDVSYSNYNVTY